MKPWTAFLLVTVLLATALRAPDLGLRVMHNDEAVNAVKFGALWDRGEYRYDPHEYHGPTLHYLTAALCWATGAPEYRDMTETRLRSVVAVAGVLLVAFLPLARRELGTVAVITAAVFTAVSPVMVFYSRYWIHEMLLVLFTYVALVAGWKFLKQPSAVWALVAGLSLGLMQATKETFVLALAAAAGAWLINWIREGRRREVLVVLRESSGKMLMLAAAWGVVWLLLFTSFFQNGSGLLDSVRTYGPWLGNAGGDSVHANPWSFYLERLYWFVPARGPISSEALLLLLAVVGGVSGFVGARPFGGQSDFVRWLAGYTVLLAGIYCVIPYKTPWCALGFHHGVILLAGVGVAVLWGACRTMLTRGLLAGVLLAGVAHLGWQAWRGNFVLPEDRSNPWVYAHTSPDLLNLVTKIDQVTSVGTGEATVIKVFGVNDDYWPLPWYLRRYRNVGWWNTADDAAPAPVVVATPELAAPLEAGDSHIMAGFFELRPQVFLQLYVERQLWERHLAARASARSD